MADEVNEEEKIVLEAEHLLLGALMGSLDEEGPDVPLRYADQDAEATALADGTALCDLSGLYALRIAGTAAEAFCSAAFGGSKLAVGECDFEPVFMGDGRLVSVPLLARTGDKEYVLWDASPSADLLAAWLSFLSDIEQNGYRPYAALDLEEESTALVPLLLWGDAATSILHDYVRKDDELPRAGHISDVSLDGTIATLVLSPELDSRATSCSFLLHTHASSGGAFFPSRHSHRWGALSAGSVFPRRCPGASSCSMQNPMRWMHRA